MNRWTARVFWPYATLVFCPSAFTHVASCIPNDDCDAMENKIYLIFSVVQFIFECKFQLQIRLKCVQTILALMIDVCAECAEE